MKFHTIVFSAQNVVEGFLERYFIRVSPAVYKSKSGPVYDLDLIDNTDCFRLTKRRYQ